MFWHSMKRKPMINRFVAIIALMLCPPTYANEASLSQLIKMGYDQNPLIKSYEQQVMSLFELD